MTPEQFTVQAPASFGIFLMAIFLAIAALVVIVAFLKFRKSGKNKQTIALCLILAIAVVVPGILVTSGGGIASTITVDSGYVSIKSDSFGGAGNLNVTSSQITSAYVARVGSGNLTLTKQHGTDYGNLNIGVYTLGNGHTAYVISNNSTDIIIQLSNGKYVILGTSDTNALATSFSNSVYPLNP